MVNKIKLLIFLSVLVLGGSIVYPLYTNIRSVTNQQAAGQALVSICRAEKIFKEKLDNNRYGNLTELGVAGLIPESLSKGVYKGFRYEIRLSQESYIVLAIPIKKSKSGYWGTGLYSMCVDESCNACENFVDK